MEFDLDISDDETFENYRTKRLNELKSSVTGLLLEFESEKELIKKSKSNTMIVHFYKPEFKRCEIMNYCLDKVAIMFSGVEFYKILADKCEIVTEKLEIKTLPFLAFFRDGFFVDSIIGFEGIQEENGETSVEILAEAIKNSELFK